MSEGHMVHNHDYDPGCREHNFDGFLIGSCLLLAKNSEPPASTFESNLNSVLDEVLDMMLGRHKKYGPGNIAEFGDLGILVRMSDKFARLKNGRTNFDDETIENTLDDIIGYALIWKMWVRKTWPGSEVANPDSRV